MRVGVLALLHESNTFISEPTTLADFEQNLLLTGAAIRQEMADAHHEVGGFFAGLEQQQLEAVPIFAARAVPYGTITAEAFEALLARMFSELERAGTLDGVLVAPHGATVSAEHRDADGYWLSELRQRVGDQLPIIGTVDAHVNLSQRMVDATDALIAYRSNPHLDQRQRGIEAATLMARTLQGEIRPTQAASMPPVAINIDKQTTSAPPCRPLYDLADEMLEQPGVLSNSILLGFPYADVEEMGSAALVVTDNDQQLAEQLARQLGDYIWDHREDFAGNLISIDDALRATAELEGPICLLDMGDNVGGGSPADSTHLAHALVRESLGPSFVCLYDPDSVTQIAMAGPGIPLYLDVGGKTDDLHGEPLVDDFETLGLYDGKFTESEPRHGGMSSFDQGATAVVRGGSGLTIMLTSHRMPPMSLQQLTSCDIDPTKFRYLVAKGVIAPVAAYEPVCRHLIRVNTPGCTSADMTTFNYDHRRRPMFPFESDAVW